MKTLIISHALIIFCWIAEAIQSFAADSIAPEDHIKWCFLGAAQALWLACISWQWNRKEGEDSK